MFWLGKSIQSGTPSANKFEVKGLSPIEFLVLAHLRSRELRNAESVGQYGYEMINELNKMFAGSWEAKSGTIYPILSKLESEKNLLLGENKPSPLGPTKKVYQLTEDGRRIIDAILKENFQSDIEFVLNYFELLTPFLLFFQNNNELEEVENEFYQIPAKSLALVMEHNTTETDQILKRQKLEAMKANLERIIRNIDSELQKTPK